MREEKNVDISRMSIRRKAKIIAKERISHNLWQAMVAVLICAVPMVLVTSFAQSYMLSTGRIVLPLAFCALAMIFVVFPIVYGLIGYLLQMLFVGQGSLMRVFDALSNMPTYIRSLKLGVCLFVRILLWMSIPFALSAAYCYWLLLRNPAAIQDIEQFSAVVTRVMGVYMLVSIPFTARVLRYVGAYPVAMRDPTVGAWQATRIAARMLKGHWGKLILLVLSFVGWQLVGLWTMGIGMLFYWAYLLSAFLMYFWYVERAQEKEKVQDVSQQQMP